MPFSKPDPYRGVVIVLLALACVGTVAAVFGAMILGNPVVLDAAVTLGLSTGVLIGVALVQQARAKPPRSDDGLSKPVPVEAGETPAPSPVAPSDAGGAAAPQPTRIPVWLWQRFQELRKLGNVRDRTAVAGVLAIGLVLLLDLPGNSPPLLVAGIAAALCLVAAGLAATAVRYLADIEPAQLPEGPGLCRGARIVAWILVLAAVSIGLAWAGQQTVLRILHCGRPGGQRGGVLRPLHGRAARGRSARDVPAGPRRAVGAREPDQHPGERPRRRGAATRYRSAFHLGAHGRPPQPGAAHHRPVPGRLALDVPDGGGR